MKIKIAKNEILKAVTIAESIISTKSINTILLNCLIKVSLNKIEVISTNNEISLFTTLKATSSKDGSFLVNGKKMASILRELPEDEVIIKVTESKVIEINTENKQIKGDYKLIGLVADEYPEIETFAENNLIEIKQNSFKEMISKVVYAASIEVVRPAYNGVFFKLNEEGEMNAVATDSARMAIYNEKIEKKEQSFEAIVPLKTIPHLTSLLEGEEKMFFSFEKNRCFFKIDNTKIISRLINERFPNYKDVLSANYLFKAKVEKDDFLASLKRIVIFTKEPIYKVDLIFKGENLTIETQTPELGEAREELIIQSLFKEEIVIRINAQLIIEALKKISEKAIELTITGNSQPVIIKPIEKQNYISVVMPFQKK